MTIQHRFRIIPLRMLKVLMAVLMIIAFMSLSTAEDAEEMNRGEMAGIIRSAGHPCARVLDLQRTDENSWGVQCNSGSFSVTHNEDGQFSVNAIDE